MEDSLYLLVLPPLLLVPAMGLLSMIRSSHKIGEEFKRKAFHVGFGLVALSFPIIWTESWMVITGFALALGWMFAVRVLPRLQKYFGSVLHDCDRKSLGEFYYAVSVAGLILVTSDSPLLYVIPILILALADAAAAIFGRLIPSKALTGFLRGKSVAGCGAFFIVAALICGAMLTRYTELAAWQIAVCALLVATATCLAEAISRRGLDNLTVPLVAWAVLSALKLSAGPALIVATDFRNSISLLISGAW
jgi:phytol kinase